MQRWGYLGHVAHLLADMTVPAHTHNDPHAEFMGIGDPDSYEETISDVSNFTQWYYNGGRSGHWAQSLTVFPSLSELFYRTVRYTTDYDSNDGNGHGPPYYSPPDYVTTWHRPQDVDNAGGDIDINEVTTIGDDLMPYAMKRTAELIRLFYSQVDTSSPSCSMTYPNSSDVNNPDIWASTDAIPLTASGWDSESGIEKNGYRFKYSYQTGTTWSAWADVSTSPTTSSVTFTPPYSNTLYRFVAYATNGGGRQGGWLTAYLRTSTTNAPPVTPSLLNPANGVTGMILTPTLQASAFSDPDGDTHANSQWQVDNNSDFSNPEWDSGQSYSASTQATVPSGELAANTTYYWRVRYKDNRGAWSQWASAPRSFTTGTQQLLPAPTQVSPPNGGANQSLTPTLIWSAVPNATSYRVLVDTDPSALTTDPTQGTFPPLAVNATPTTAYYTIPAGTLYPGTRYYWEVKGRNVAQYGAWSTKWSFTTASASTPTIALSPASLARSAVQGSNATSQQFKVRNAGSGTLTYAVTDDQSWMSVTPTSGTSTGEEDSITVNYSTSGLSSGTYSGLITVSATGASNTPKQLPVTLTVSSSSHSEPGVLAVMSADDFIASGNEGGPFNPSMKTYTLKNTGDTRIEWDFTPGGDWISPSDDDGFLDPGETHEVTVSIDADANGFAAGAYSATLYPLVA